MRRLTLCLIVFMLINSTIFGHANIPKDLAPTVKNGKVVSTLETVNEKLTGILSQYWIPNDWHDGGRFLYEYNGDGNITTMYMDSLHNGEWKTLMSMTVEYDGNKPITDIIRMYEIDGTSEFGTKNVTSYNGDKEAETVQYSWDVDASDWVLSMKYVYEYTNNLISKISDFKWDELSNAWEPYAEDKMTYDSQGREIEGLRTTWDSQQSAFVNSGFTTTEYYKDLLISRIEGKSWDVATSSWSSENYDLTINQYNSNDKMIESVSTYSMGFGGFSFVMKDSTIFEYDTNNFLIVETTHNWQDFVGYAPFTKVEYNNDASGNVLDEIHYTYSGLETWVAYNKLIYTYDGAVTVDNVETLPSEFSVEQNYPNPFNPITTINYSLNNTGEIELRIYDVLGNNIATILNKTQTAGNYSVEFDGSNLSSGTYFYTLNNGVQIITKKCVLIK